MIEKIVYLLCGFTSILCSLLLLRRYLLTRTSLLFWSTGCFCCLALTNVLLFFDLIIFPNIDLSNLRSCITLAGVGMLLYGLIRERT